MGEITLLVDHYTRLLRTEEENYHGLIQQAYSTREHYETFLNELSAAEREVDQAVAEFPWRERCDLAAPPGGTGSGGGAEEKRDRAHLLLRGGHGKAPADDS